MDHNSANKENFRYKKKTKLQAPMHALPPVPNHLTIHHLDRKDDPKLLRRQPLQTLGNEAGSSKANPRVKVSTPYRLDTRYVTVRRKEEESLDWKLKNVRDRPAEESSRQNGKRTEECSAKQQTPQLPSSQLVSNRIKNIKRSLKRPHSRELLGVTPKKRNLEDRSRKHCGYSYKEKFSDRLKTPDLLLRQYTHCLTRDYVENIFDHLLSTETKPIPIKIPNATRACVVNWLMKVNGPDGDPGVIQTACWYLDAVLEADDVALEKLQLVASACFWIAQKLSQTSVPAGRLVKASAEAFTATELIIAEKIILDGLNYPSQPVVPNDFISYFAWNCDCENPGEIEIAAAFLCMAGILVNSASSRDFPSVVAAAAVRNTVYLLRKRDAVQRLGSCDIYQKVIAKASNFSSTCLSQRLAVRMLSSEKYEYRAPFEHYCVPPHFIARRIVNAASFPNNDSIHRQAK